MKISELLYRAARYLRHGILAWNSRGGGVHSPYLFELVHFVICDDYRYYVWDSIEELRYELLHDSQLLDYVDFGSHGSSLGVVSQRRVCEIAFSSLEAPKYAQLLFRMVNWLGEQKHKKQGRTSFSKGLTIVELGSSLGITTAYLASSNKADNVISFEGCPAVAALAQKNWQRLGLTNIRCVLGNIDQTLMNHSLVTEDVDFVFIDANHTSVATYNYFEMFLGALHDKSVVVVDDIYHNDEMTAAWEMIKKHPKVTTTIDLYKLGIVFFDPCYLHKHYKVKL